MITQRLIFAAALLITIGCDKDGSGEKGSSVGEPAAAPAPKAEFMPPTDPKNILNIAGGSKDHSTLVSALKTAEYQASIANTGPMTVFAPTNEAFDKLPKGTLESLSKPDKQEDLRNILKYHVAVSTYEQADFKDGETLGMANGKHVKIHVKDGKVTINDATIVASIRASNGIVHVVDRVLLPPAK